MRPGPAMTGAWSLLMRCGWALEGLRLGGWCRWSQRGWARSGPSWSMRCGRTASVLLSQPRTFCCERQEAPRRCRSSCSHRGHGKGNAQGWL